MAICSIFFLKARSYFARACGQKCCFRRCFGYHEEHFSAFVVHFFSGLLLSQVFFVSLMVKIGCLFKAVSGKLSKPDLAKGEESALFSDSHP